MSMKRVIAFALLFSFVGLLSACNTTRGVGEDIEGVGGAIKRTAS